MFSRLSMLLICLSPAVGFAQMRTLPPNPGITRGFRPSPPVRVFGVAPASPLSVWARPTTTIPGPRIPSIGMPRDASGRIMSPPPGISAPYPTPGPIPFNRLREMREDVAGVGRTSSPQISAELAAEVWPGRPWDSRPLTPCPAGAVCRNLTVTRRSVDVAGGPRVDGIAVHCRLGQQCAASPHTVEVDLSARERGRPRTSVSLFPSEKGYSVGNSSGPAPSEPARFGMQRLGDHLLRETGNQPGSDGVRSIIREGGSTIRPVDPMQRSIRNR